MAQDGWTTDDHVSARFPLYVRAQVYGAVVSPLMESTTFATNDRLWRRSQVELGFFTDDELDWSRRVMSVVFGGYVYTNLSMMRVAAQRAPGLTPQLVDILFTGAIAEPTYEPVPGDDSPEATARIQRVVDAFEDDPVLPQLDEDRAWLTGLRAARPDLATGTDEVLVRRWQEAAGAYERTNWSHTLVTTMSALHFGRLSTACSELLGDAAMSSVLLADMGGVESTGTPLALWDLSRRIRRSPVLSAAYDDGGLSGLEDRLATSEEGREFLAAIADFVAVHGSRGHTEFELVSPTFETSPTFLHSSLDRLRAATEEHGPKVGSGDGSERAKLVADTLARIEATAPGESAQFARLLGAAEAVVRGRERTKAANILALHEGRVALLELGARMTERGIFENREQIAMLRHDELDPFVTFPEAFVALVQERQSRFDALSAVEPPVLVHAEVPPHDTWKRRGISGADRLAVGEHVTGLSGNAGIARGIARVILDPTQGLDMGDGDVLVAPETDSGWMPLFLAAAGVVVDNGSQLSHAVVVCRELGLPCVVSVADGTRRIPDGALIEVDGTTGRVTVLEPA